MLLVTGFLVGLLWGVLLANACTECYTTRIVDQYGKVIVCEVCSELDPTSHQVVSHQFKCRPE